MTKCILAWRSLIPYAIELLRREEVVMFAPPKVPVRRAMLSLSSFELTECMLELTSLLRPFLAPYFYLFSPSAIPIRSFRPLIAGIILLFIPPRKLQPITSVMNTDEPPLELAITPICTGGREVEFSLRQRIDPRFPDLKLSYPSFCFFIMVCF